MSLTTRSLFLALVGLASFGVAGNAMAQTAPAAPTAVKADAPKSDAAKSANVPPAAETQKVEEPAKIWSFTAGVDFTNAYFFRGILQENQGFIAQPSGELAINFFNGGEGSKLNSVSVFGGWWNSIHSGPTGHDDDGGFRDNPLSWYEADIYGGLRALAFDKVSIDLFYTCYYSPNASFGAVHEIATKVGYNDSDILKEWALSPYVLMAFELDDEADAGNSINNPGPGFHRGGYCELGIEPKLDIFKSKDIPITFSFPVKMGLSMYDYYQDASTEDSTFGYASIGAWMYIPLGFIPPQAGTWTLALGGTVMFLGNNTSEVNNDRSVAGIATARITLAF
jgi:hypothetical protein